MVKELVRNAVSMSWKGTFWNPAQMGQFIFDGGVKVEKNYEALNLGINGKFDFAKVEKSLPPIGLEIAQNTTICD